MKQYIDLAENAAGFTHIKIDTWYKRDGRRGYYLTVTPVTRENRSGYILESFECFSGYTQLIQEVTRKSAKAEAAAEAAAADIIDIMVSRVCQKNGLEVKTV